MKLSVRQFLSILLIFFCASNVFGQKMKVTGTVMDTTGSRPLPQATVMAIRVKDSLLLGFTHSDFKGNFTLTGFEIDTFSLVIAHPNADDKTYYIFGHKDNYEINIPSVRMQSKAQELDEVVIYANKNPIYYKGDTLIYVADSFKVAEGAVVEDLLKKLPGLNIDKDGKITSQGQTINKVLVDGDEFFGTDPTVATKNLGADGVAQVQVYEKTDEETIGGSQDKIRVLDLKLKDEAKKGYFGRVSGATDAFLTPLPTEYFGTRPFYEGELLLNKFNSKQKISIFALGSNTPRSSFGRGDLNKFGLSNEAGANRNFWENDNNQNNSGVPQTLKTGIYYADKFGENKNTELLVNYSYYNDRLDARTSSQSQYFLQDTSFFNINRNQTLTTNQRHAFNIKLSSQIDSLTLIEFKPSFSYDIGQSINNDTTSFEGETNIQSLITSINSSSDSKGLTVNGTGRVYRKFMKKRRELEVRYDLAMNRNNTNSELKTENQYLLYVDSVAGINQYKTNKNSATSHYGTLSYFEPLSKKWKVNLTYLFEYGFSNQNKETNDLVGTAYTGYNANLSNNFDNTRTQHRGGTEFIYESGKHFVSGGAFVRNIQIDNINKITNATIYQNINSVLPRFKYEFKPSMSKRFSVNYTTNSQQPSINDVQPVQDNSNPNRLVIGNPDLKPNYVHNVMVNFNNWNALSGKYIWSGGSLNLTNNAFATQTSYDAYGRTTSMTVNVDGNFSAFVWAGAGFPILDRKVEFNPSLNASVNRYKSLIEESGVVRVNTTDNYAITPDMQIEVQLDSLEITFNGSYSFNKPINSISTTTTTPFGVQKYGMDLTWRLPKGFSIEMEGNYTKNNGLYNTEFFILNAEFSKKFLATQNLIVSIRGNDLLNQNISAQRTVSGNAVTDYRTTIISRYFLLKVTLRFNNRKAKEDDFKGWH